MNSWSGGFQAQVVISDTGGSASSSWTANWTWPGPQQVSSGWNGVFSESGTNVTVTSEPYNGSIAPGGSVTIGFTATGPAPATVAVTC